MPRAAWHLRTKSILSACWQRRSVFPIASRSAAAKAVGDLVGFGTEYALGNNWSVKAEYDYMNFGSRTLGLTGTDTAGGVTCPIAVDAQIDQAAIHVAKVGVNYRFGGLQIDPTFAPVPAAPGYNWSGAYIGAQGG
jgi:outer membrane immunogenic protein